MELPNVRAIMQMLIDSYCPINENTEYTVEMVLNHLRENFKPDPFKFELGQEVFVITDKVDILERIIRQRMDTEDGLHYYGFYKLPGLSGKNAIEKMLHDSQIFATKNWAQDYINSNK